MGVWCIGGTGLRTAERGARVERESVSEDILSVLQCPSLSFCVRPCAPTRPGCVATSTDPSFRLRRTDACGIRPLTWSTALPPYLWRLRVRHAVQHSVDDEAVAVFQGTMSATAKISWRQIDAHVRATYWNLAEWRSLRCVDLNSVSNDPCGCSPLRHPKSNQSLTMTTTIRCKPGQRQRLRLPPLDLGRTLIPTQTCVLDAGYDLDLRFRSKSRFDRCTCATQEWKREIKIKKILDDESLGSSQRLFKKQSRPRRSRLVLRLLVANFLSSTEAHDGGVHAWRKSSALDARAIRSRQFRGIPNASDPNSSTSALQLSDCSKRTSAF
uniref:Uncharacterized protein n=1 Tax=Mycena chlorophos TaxID=658473 RepID=A0ABQ0LKM7_MYCCL|nr:predicted protein [Mycena chlorophos]